MASTRPIRLLDAEPDLGRYLTPEDHHVLEGLPVPTVLVARGELELGRLLKKHHAYGAVVLDGMLVRRLRVGEQTGLRLLGPGDLLGAPGAPASSLLVASSWQAAAPTRLALLEREVLLAVRRTPRLAAGMHARVAEQVDRVAVQLAICQLARVEHRLLSLLWLLAESWGQVTPSGTALRLHLTHETLGGLVGARRPTVTLALGELVARGSLAKQDRGWLLLDAPPAGSANGGREHLPELLPGAEAYGGQEHGPAPAAGGAPSSAVLRAGVAQEIAATVARLREQHDASVDRLRTGRDQIAETRQRSRLLRERIARERELRRAAAPSGR
jgi:CRP/FNR family cyclic AMP-dependent transcriptional regulator